MSVIISKIKNNIVIRNYSELGIIISKNGNLIIPIISLTSILKYLFFSSILDYKIVQSTINEYKELMDEYRKEI